MRSTLSPAFTGSKMRQMFELVAKVCKQGTTTLKEKIIKNETSNEIEFKELASKFTVDNIATCAFGIEVNSFEDPNNSFQGVAKEITDFSNLKTVFKFAGYLIAPWLMKFFGVSFISKSAQKFFQEAIIDTINTREEKGIVRHDMINLLMQVKKGNLNHEVKEEEKIVDGFATVEESEVGKSQSKRVWEDIDLAAQCFVFFLAGFDTVSTTIGFMAYELMRNPEVQEKLFDEISACDEELNGKIVSYEKVQNLKYLDQVVSEVLRMWPAAPGTDRICSKNYEYDFDGLKFTFDEGYNFFIPIYGFHQ
jgi:cytochrome P450 family 9